MQFAALLFLQKAGRKLEYSREESGCPLWSSSPQALEAPAVALPPAASLSPGQRRGNGQAGGV